jgi:hypothetical protein
VFRGDLALDDEVDSIRAELRSVQQHRQDLGGESERRVRDDPVTRTGETHLAKIRFDHAGRAVSATFEARAELTRPGGIALDRPDDGSRVEERMGERTDAGTEFDDQLTGAKVE